MWISGSSTDSNHGPIVTYYSEVYNSSGMSIHTDNAGQLYMRDWSAGHALTNFYDLESTGNTNIGPFAPDDASAYVASESADNFLYLDPVNSATFVVYYEP